MVEGLKALGKGGPKGMMPTWSRHGLNEGGRTRRGLPRPTAMVQAWSQQGVAVRGRAADSKQSWS